MLYTKDKTEQFPHWLRSSLAALNDWKAIEAEESVLDVKSYEAKIPNSLTKYSLERFRNNTHQLNAFSH